MIKNCDKKFISSILLFFFRFIFHHGVIPNNLNITHIHPIKKDKNKSINELNNFSQIFERLLMTKINAINNTNCNQFGYKNITSCTHA